MTQGTRAAPRSVLWYRTPVDTEFLRGLHRRSDALGLLQTLGFLGVLALTGTAAFLSLGRLPWYATVGLTFLHGMISAFYINGVHEVGHGTVFKTRALTWFFVRVLSFLGWINFQHFQASHTRHHKYTLHPPDDLEVVLPARFMVKHFFKQGFVNPWAAWGTLKNTIRLARGRWEGDWENTLFPESEPAKGRPTILWARTMLVGHGLILAGAIYFQLWMIPVLVTLAPFYGCWLFFLCNNTQHIGLQDNVPDFRLCCRTFLLNPVVKFFYWHMNYHTEHHMYAAVPCYKLGRLHRAIRHDLPPCPRGIVATWKEIAAIQVKQDADPTYQHVAAVPQAATA